MTHDVFISYSSIDKAAADAACAVFEGEGIRCWIAPRDIPAGAEWAESIINAIEGARVEGKNKQQAPPELLEEVFELNESLDELREAKASGRDTSGLKPRLEAAEKNFQGNLAEVDAEFARSSSGTSCAITGESSRVRSA